MGLYGSLDLAGDRPASAQEARAAMAAGVITGNYLSLFSLPGNCPRRATTRMHMIVPQRRVSHELRGFG